MKPLTKEQALSLKPGTKLLCIETVTDIPKIDTLFKGTVYEFDSVSDGYGELIRVKGTDYGFWPKRFTFTNLFLRIIKEMYVN